MIIDSVAGEIICLVASVYVCVCVCVSIRLSVGAVLFNHLIFDHDFWLEGRP